MQYSLRPLVSATDKAKIGAYSDLMTHLLYHRGIRESEQAERFMSPDYVRDTHHPFLLKDAENAANRIIQAIKNGEKIAIYSDYDADGIPGAAMMSDFFRQIGYNKFTVYIPHRHNEGFGFHKNAVDALAEEKVNLIMTIDCGISDVATTEYANSKGIEVIITDHHEPPHELPKAFAIVDHKQNGCGYPDKNLCGSGVAYKLIQAILEIERFGLKEGMEKWFLDLVGIATLSDMVPLQGENRVFAYYGLSVMRKSRRKGLQSLFKLLKMDQKRITEEDIAFMLTPRINAASRMGVSSDAYKLLATDDENEAALMAEELDHINNERKGIVAGMVKEAKKMIKDRYGSDLPRVLVLGNPDWRPSLLGLVANSCSQEFGRPSFFWGRDGDNIIKGSCRSEGKTNVVELMRGVPPETFIHYGGHKMSGGFAVHNDHIHFFEDRLNAASSGLSGEGDTVESSEVSENVIDAELSLDDVSDAVMRDIEKLGPFGTGNPKPIFIFKDVVLDDVRTFGKSKEHVEISMKRERGGKVKAISFFGAEKEWAKNVNPGDKVHLVANMERSYFRGMSELRLRINDVFYK